MNKMATIALAGLLACATANAGGLQLGGDTYNDNSTSYDQSQYADGGDADATGVGVGVGVGVGGEGGDGGNAHAGAYSDGGDAYSGSISEGGDADSYSRSTSDADSTSLSSAQSGSSSGAVASGNGGDSNVSVQGGSTTYSNKTRALALSLPAATAGHGASAPCLVTTRGVTAVGVGASGNTKIDPTCYNDLRLQKMFENCMIVADAYARLGNEQLLVPQLVQCRELAIASVKAGR